MKNAQLFLNGLYDVEKQEGGGSPILVMHCQLNFVVKPGRLCYRGMVQFGR